MRAVAADPSPFAQMAAIALLTAPGPAVLDAAFAQLAGSRRVDVPLRQHIEELYATRCAACRRPVVAEQFVWPRDGDAPGRKIYRCEACDLSRGGPEERSAPVDEVDLAKLGIERATGDPVPPGDEPEATASPPPGEPDASSEGGDELDLAIGESGGPPPAPRAVDPPSPVADGPRFASTVRPEPIPVAAAEGARLAPHYLELRDRFPVLDDREDLVDELLDLYTPRNLYALHAIGAKIDTELRDTPASAVMKLALASCLLPASRLNGYPGRVASLRISAGHVRQPASRHQREVNVWRAFSEAYGEVRVAIEALGDRHEARFAADFGELGGMTSANVLWLRARASVVGQYLPSRRRRSRALRPRSEPDHRGAGVRVPGHAAGSSDARRPRRCASSRSSEAVATRREPRQPRCATAWVRRPARSSPVAGASSCSRVTTRSACSRWRSPVPPPASSS